MHVVDTSAIQNYPAIGDDSAFLPSATFGFVNSTKILTITSAAPGLPTGHTFARVNIEVFDRSGGKKDAHIDTATGNAAIDLDAAPSLDLTREINIKVTVTTNKGLSKDGWYYGLLPVADAAGSLGFE